MKFITTALIPLLWLSGCAAIPFDLSTLKLILPDMPAYTADQQDHMAAEVQSNSCPYLTEAMKDYGIMRDQVRAAKK